MGLVAKTAVPGDYSELSGGNHPRSKVFSPTDTVMNGGHANCRVRATPKK